ALDAGAAATTRETAPPGQTSAGIDTTRVMIRPGASEPVAPEVGRIADALAAAAGDGELWLSAPAARQVAAHVELIAAPEVLGQRALKVAGAAALPAPPARAVPARPRELARLEALARACFESRTPRFVEVRGGPGTGKTHLRAAFMARVAERRDVDWLVAAAAPLGEAAPLSLLRTADAEWYEVTGRAAGDRAATLAMARRWLDARAVARPVALLLDDVQWADEASRAVVTHLATHLDDVPVMVAVWSREPVNLPGAEVIELAPLDDATALRLAREAAPLAGDDELVELVTRAGGNPFFIEELAREVAERGGADSTLPPTVEAAVQARLDRLSADAVELLGAAAVVGRGFWRDAVRAALATAIDDADLDAGLAELERKGLVFPAPPTGVDDERYQFGQALIRDVAYQRLSPRDRRRAHAAVARWLAGQLDGATTRTATAATPPPAAAADPDLLWALAHHRELGGDAAGAAASWRVAGLRSLDLFAYQQAYAALRRAFDLAGADADPILAERLGEAAYNAHTLEAAEAAYDFALDRTAADDDATRARLWFRQGQVASALADQARALACYERGLALVAPGGELTAAARRDPRQAALLFGAWGWVRSYQKGADDAAGLAACERAVELLDGTSHRRELAHALSRLGGAYMRAGRWGDQRRANQRNLEIAHELGDLEAQITARINLGFVLGNLGDLDAAIAHTEHAIELCRRTGARPVAGLALSNLAGYLLERGDLAASQRRLAEGIRLLEQTGQRRVLPESHQFAARLAARRGDLDGARAAIQTAIGMARAADAAADAGVGLRILAQVEARRGDLAAAEAALAEATQLLGDADAYERARLDAARARVGRAAGRLDEAAAARAAAAAVFACLGAAIDQAALDDDLDVR
ncbi:MAG TPA: AAA family ATPase, partial [Kofleriaceae bacterium]|nr:AAA family ATPase [Kofleriaceae bacterium]